MKYRNDDEPVRKSIAIASTSTGNAVRYRKSNAQVYLNPEGLPVAFREVLALKPGTFAAASHHQIITPKETSRVSRKMFEKARSCCDPLN